MGKSNLKKANSVEIKSKSNSFNVVGDATSLDMVERIDAVLEGNPVD